ncbi:MAG: 3-methyl-2-oxobutanoate hydroxymethyltransferase [Nitrosopumilus sp.]|nr:3-methyl-2-oxobutanoate hydroxymethyltransferase [Nitrosopumilus sp.]MDH3735727.1 3-methyl-2-oxobutanoate hydroxymethyltransferase [Nitrosopumilus sp.]MDH3822142.1 3-methyl-2-oxobutanoate hydroxymethyltransferase [Nitrosopumilus sp.]MDH3832950.1 3-methyl-2-oxobutanoate hydroxymethyltransferase [Nitrosopumilus sp.]
MHKSVQDIINMKKEKKKISVITGYDYSLASLCDKAGIDVLLVGDSAGMVMLGYENTIPVTMEQMSMFTEAVSRARKNSLLVSDLPFMSYQTSIEDAINNSGRLIKAGADAVKLEGGSIMAETISAIVDIGIPVMGHIGLQPQTTILSQGYKVQGKTKDAAIKLIEDAKELEEAGVFSIALEMVSHEVAQIISETVNIPTIGIGSGAGCDGQVLVVQDVLGMYNDIKPKFAKRYMNLSEDIVKSLEDYKKDVELGTFPAEENCFSMDKEELKKLREQIGG